MLLHLRHRGLRGIDAPLPAAPVVALHGDGGWTVAGLQTDLAPAFAARVAEVKRWNSVRGDDHPEPAE